MLFINRTLFVCSSPVPVDIQQPATVYKDLGQSSAFVFIHSFGDVDSMVSYYGKLLCA